MYKIKRVYICDICQKVGLPVEHIDYFDCWKGPPEGWHTVGKYHYCEDCFTAVKKIKTQEKRKRKTKDYEQTV